MLNFKPLALFCGHTAQFVSDMSVNFEARFSHDAAQLSWICKLTGEKSHQLSKEVNIKLVGDFRTSVKRGYSIRMSQTYSTCCYLTCTTSNGFFYTG